MTTKKRPANKKKTHKPNVPSAYSYDLYNGKTATLSLIQQGVINSIIVGNTFDITFPNIETIESLMHTHNDSPLVEEGEEYVRIWDLSNGSLLDTIGFDKEKYLMEMIERTNDSRLITRKFLQESGMKVRWKVTLEITIYERNTSFTKEQEVEEKKKIARHSQFELFHYMTNLDRNYGSTELEFDLPATPLWIYGTDVVDGVQYDNIQMMRTDGKMVKGEEYMKNPVTFLEKCMNLVGESLEDDAYSNYEICGLKINSVVKGL